MSDDGEYVQLAKIAEQAERYEDMVKNMIKVIKETKKGQLLSNEERNLLSVAYKNVVGGFRSSWRTLTSILEREKEKENNQKAVEQVEEYKKKIEKELNEKCDEVLDLLDTELLTSPTDAAAKVFYLKMKGDYNRYKVEVADEEDQQRREKLVQESDNAYNKAQEACKEIDSKMDPICLGLALNYSVFYYEIARKPEEACALAKKAFEEALEELQQNQDSSNSAKDSTLIMQLLQDNLTLWSSEDEWSPFYSATNSTWCESCGCRSNWKVLDDSYVHCIQVQSKVRPLRNNCSASNCLSASV